MPTATSVSGYSLYNNGPLTTTFSAPATCTTNYIALGRATNPTEIEWFVTCPFVPPANCNPSGSVIQSIYSAGEGHDPKAGNVIVYHSPGFICPAGWVTVGAAARPNPTSTSISGAFNVSSAIPTAVGEAFFLPQQDAIIEALEPGETAVLCCPSSFTPLNAACYSTLPSSVYTPSTGCLRVFTDPVESTVLGTYTIDGETVTADLITVTATGSYPIVTDRTTFTSSDATSFVGVFINDMFTLIYQASDTAATATATGAAATTTATKSEARSILAHENKFGVTTVCCLAIALGSFFALY
ncbi:hypothetical protein SEUCBS139899_009690 [Sporothrix eucalyptigena]|uniref:Uncharacterized protein n=1 Tax=Sporothrix eucalyptigena TaxID=1812306 RepID=A0ABP0CEY1_9PEZI